MSGLTKWLRIMTVLFSLEMVVNNFSYAETLNEPSVVYVESGPGAKLLLVKRPTDNVYWPFVIKGVNWSPATKAPKTGETLEAPSPFREYIVWYGFFLLSYHTPLPHADSREVLKYWLQNQLFEYQETDIALMKQMNVNTVQIYDNLGPEGYERYDERIVKLLDEFYNNNIMVIMNVAVSIGDLNSKKYLKAVDSYRNHPAILMWSISTEWNYNIFYRPDKEWDFESLAKTINDAAREIKAIDRCHPVCSILTDQMEVVPTILKYCPDVDLWGVNLYRGESFGNFFQQWKELWQNIGQPDKAFFISGFGIDSYYTQSGQSRGAPSDLVTIVDYVAGREDQEKQANIDASLWREIKANLAYESYKRNYNDLCLGGLLYDFNDALWKIGNDCTVLWPLVSRGGHSYDDYSNEAVAVGQIKFDDTLSESNYVVQNVEFSGLVSADRIPKLAYWKMKEEWADNSELPQSPVVRDEGNYVIQNTYGSVQLEFHWSIADADTVNEFQYKITEGSTEGTVIVDWTSVGLSDWVIAGVPTVNGKTYYCSVKAINKAGEAIGYSDGITVDTTKPTGSIKITKILPFTPCSSKAELFLNAVDTISSMGEGAQMSFSYDGSTWRAPQAYCTSLTLALMPGAKTLYVKFRDVAGNWSDVYSAAILYPDKTPPQITHTPIKSAPKYRDIIFTANITDSESGIESVTLYWQKRILRIWGWTWSESRKVAMAYQGDDTYKAALYSNQTENCKIKYYIQAKDKAGNVKKTNAVTISR